MFFCQHHLRFSFESYARSPLGRFRPLFGAPSRSWHPHRVHYVGEKDRFVTLSSRKKGGHRKSTPVGHRMYFGGEPSPAVSESRTYSFVFSGGSVPFLAPKGPPAAERLARTVVLCAPNCSQSMRPSASSSPWSVSTIDCKVPSSAHRRSRSWAAHQEPYRSGRSRQGAPEPSALKIPFTTFRWSL